MLFSLSFAQEVKISNVGIKDLSQFMIKDFTFKGEIENLFILEDVDSLSYLYFKGFLNDMSIQELKRTFKSIKDENLRTQLEFEIFKLFRNKIESQPLKVLFDDLQVSEKMKLLFAIENNEYESKFSNPAYNAFLNSYRNYTKGQISVSINVLEPYKNDFPNTFIFYLLSNNEIEKAKKNIRELGKVDKNLIFYADYLSGECNRILNDKDYPYNYSLELMKMDCSVRLGIEYEVPKLAEEISKDLHDDDFTIIRLFSNKNILLNENIYPFFETFYYRWKLLSYVTFLESYLHDMESFKIKIRELKKEFKSLKAKYLNNNNTLKISEDEIIKKRFINLESMMSKLEMVDNIGFSELSIKEIYESLYKSYQEAKNNLKKEYLFFGKFLSEEEERLTLEKEFRILDKIIAENKDIQNLDELIDNLDRLIREGQKKNVSFIEKAYYDKIFLMWNRYLIQKIGDEKKRTERLNEIITLITNYMNRYKNFDKSIYLILAEANDHLGNNDEALKHYKNFLNFNYSKDIPTRVYIKIGDIYFDKKDYKSARESYIKAKDSNGIYRVVAIYKIAWTYYLEENFEKVLELLLNEDIYLNKEISQVLLNEIIELIAKTFYKMKKGLEADNYLSKTIVFPYPEKVFKAIGDLHVSLAEYDKALEVYEKGLRIYYTYINSPSLLASKIELLTFLGKEMDSYNERLRFNELYKKGSLYYEKFNIIPQEYDEIVLTAGYYFANKYETNKDNDSFEKASSILLDYLDSLPESKKAGEVNFLLGQLYFENLNYEQSANYYKSAYLKKFNEEESFYGYINNLYLLWKKGLIKSELLIEEFGIFTEIFYNSPKYTKVCLVLTDVYIKNKNQETALNIIDNLIEKSSKEDIKTIVEFLSNRFEEIDNKIKLANLFERCYSKDNSLKYKELKHFVLFSYAQELENQKDLQVSKKIYLSILDDHATKFREPALYNLAILESQTGDKKRALEVAKEVGEGEFKKKALEFMFSVGLESGYLEFAGEAAEKIGLMENKKEMLFKAIELYIKSNRLNDANRLMNFVNKIDLTELENDRLSILKGIYFYRSEEFHKSAEIFKSLLMSKRFDIFNFEEISLLNEITKKIILMLSDWEAKEYLENFIELCSSHYRETGYIGYKYLLGSILLEYSTFFVNKEEAIKKGIEIIKSALKESIEMEEQEITLKLVVKLKEFYPDKKFILPLIQVEEEIMGILQE